MTQVTLSPAEFYKGQALQRRSECVDRSAGAPHTGSHRSDLIASSH